jgi:hypothetical protein
MKVRSITEVERVHICPEWTNLSPSSPDSNCDPIIVEFNDVPYAEQIESIGDRGRAIRSASSRVGTKLRAGSRGLSRHVQ